MPMKQRNKKNETINQKVLNISLRVCHSVIFMNQVFIYQVTI